MINSQYKSLFENVKIKYAKLAFISSLVVIIDQATKIVILNTMALYHSVPVIPGFFSITHIHNRGGAFGILADQSSIIIKFLFLFVSSLAACFVLYFYKKTPEEYPFLASAFSMIFGGAVGNLIDRIRIGEVVDFLDFYIGEKHWPAFNVADSAITVGVIIFIFHILLNKMPEY
ncbi:MAG: signal peptidase II [Desulfobacteraceae bacterium]|nr:signal peptidase II [Desulfobacteraceae bacterium]